MKRTLAMILAIVMVIGVFPATVFAAEEFKITLTSDVEDVSALDVGSKITVTANLENNPGFAGIVTNLVWDNTVVKFEGFNVRYSEDLEQDVMVSDLVKTATYNQETGTVVYGSEKNVTKAGGKLWEAVFTVLKGGETGIALNTDGQEFQMTNANLEKLTPVIDQTALAGLTVEHTCVHVETVVAPTCTEGGYTLHKCACGDEYRTANTPAAGHKYENNVCTVCGAPGTVIPEGAKFTDMLTDKGEIVTVTEKDGYYLVEVPYGTTSLLVTYPEELPKVDEFGYVTTRMVGFDGVSQDGYGITRKDGNIIVGLALEKAPSNGAPTVVRLINLDNKYGKKITVCMADGSEETFALTYKLGNGQYFAVLPLPEDCVGYSITGEPIASDGYSFNVSILEGYEATENFAVKVNGQTVSNEPGRISIPSVTEDLKVTVEGVGKVQNNTTDVIFNVDLTAAPSGMWGDIMIQDKNSNFIEEPVASNQQSTAAIAANDHAYSKLRIYEIKTALITGWEVNGTVYPEGGKQYVGDLCIWNRGSYMQVEYNGTTPITVNVKPVFVEAPDGKYHVFHTAADEYTITGEPYAGNGYTFNVAISAGYRATSDFAVKVNGKTVATVPGDITLDTVSDHIVITVEGIAVLGGTITDNIPVIDDNISVRSIDIMKADVDSYQWDGDTLNVVLAEGTAPNATIKTKWTMDVRNTNDGAEYCEFIFNDDYLYCEASAGTLEQTMNVTLADGTATATAAFTMCDCDDPVWDITFTPKTYTVNFYVGEMPHIHDYESVVTPPTCTEGGYTTYTCKAGDDTYVAERVPALGHTNAGGTCSVCGAPLTVIPEGAKFIDMVNDKDESVTVTAKDGYYLVEVPYGTNTLYVTYPEELPYVDTFGYVKTRMIGFGGVSDDGYGKTQKDGKISVGLALEKSPANGAPTVLRLINLDNEYSKRVAIVMADDSEEIFALTYKLGDGQYFAVLPVPEDCIGYTVTGEPIASDGYTFNVSVLEGYGATENFAVKVNGETVATEPGNITIDSVTGDLKVTVEGVEKIVEETDVSITFDLTDYTGSVDSINSYMSYLTTSYVVSPDMIPEAGKSTTLACKASEINYFNAGLRGVSSEVIGYEINGTEYELPASGDVRYDFANGVWVVLVDNGDCLANAEMQYDWDTFAQITPDPYTLVIKPIVEEPEQPEPDQPEPFDPGFGITVNETAYSFYDGGTDDMGLGMGEYPVLTVTVPAGTTSATFTCDSIGMLEIMTLDMTSFAVGLNTEVPVEENGSVYLALYNGGMSIYFVKIDVAAAEQPDQPASNPITEIELAHPNIVTDDEGNMTMSMVKGASETIGMSFTAANAELEATQIVYWSSSNESVAAVDQNGKITALTAGTTTITAKAVDASGIALAAEEDEVLAQFTLTVADPAAGYTVTMGEDVEAVVNNTVSVPVTIGHTGDVTKYNAFDLTFEYDPTVLELTSTKIDGMTVTVKDGKIHVERYGTDLTVGSTALTLTFKAIATGNTNVKVTSAKVDISESALTKDAPDASVIDNITLVAVTGFTVSLPAEFTGESSVLPGENYTFEAKDKNYNYTFDGSTMDGQPVTVKDNGDGTFTIENVTGNIVIQTVPTGKTFDITLGEDMTDNVDQAQYMTDYTATLTKKDGFTYNIKVTIGGKDYTGFTYDASTGLITIPGEAITGEIVFNSNKTAKTPDKHSVEFTGEYGDIAEGTLMEVDNGTNYILTINKVLGYKYTVTATMGGETVEVKDNGDGTYTIENVTGDLVITIAKEYDLAVNVDEYVKLNGKVMFLVTATGSVDEGKILAYDGTAMFWSNQYNAWSYLVITEGTLSVEDAKALITLNEGEKVELAQTYNINESASGTVDINDAQLVFDMYNNKYQDFDNATMQKFLKADVNGDKTINTGDAAAVVSEIVKNK